MAEKKQSLLSKVSLNPLDPAALKELDNNFGVSTMEKQVSDRSAKLRRDVLGSAGFKDQFTRILNRQAPVEKEIADAGQALSGIENPYVRRQAMDNATSAKNLRRQDIAGQFNDTLTTRLQAEQLLLTQQNNELANARAERNAALNIVGQQYLDTLRNNQEMANYQKKLDIDRSLGIGDFAPRGGGGGGGGGDPTPKVLTFGGEDILYMDGQEVGRSPVYDPEVAQEKARIDALRNLGGGQQQSGGNKVTNFIRSIFK